MPRLCHDFFYYGIDSSESEVTNSKLNAIAVIALCFSAPAVITSAVAGQVLAPHRAVYDLDLKNASDRSGISGISGRMVYEFNGSSCEGYTVNFRFVTQIDTKDVSRMTDQQTSTYEDGDGKTFTFVTKSFVDETLDKEVKGTASIGDDGAFVALKKPETQKISLPATRFPTQHMLELLEKADSGESFYETSLFDGSDQADRVMTTTVVIGKKAESVDNDPELSVAKVLAQKQFWPVSIAYFDEQTRAGEGLPEYRIGFKLYRNGVTRDLTMDYGEFSMTGKLVDLAVFESNDNCSG